MVWQFSRLAFGRVYQNLGRCQKKQWINRGVSSLYGLLSGFYTMGVLFNQPNLTAIPLHSSTSEGDTLLCITVGFLAYDTLLMCVHPNALLSSWIVIHHLANIVGLATCLAYHTGCYWALLMLSTEVPPPLPLCVLQLLVGWCFVCVCARFPQKAPLLICMCTGGWMNE